MNLIQESSFKRSDMPHELSGIEHDRAACPPATHTPGRAYSHASLGPAFTDHEHATTERNGPVRHLMLVLVEHEQSVNPDWQLGRRVIGGRDNLGRAEIVDLLTALQDDGEGRERSAELRHCVETLIAACVKPCESGAGVIGKPMLGGPLSEREGAVLNLIADGLSNKEIARNLVIAPETVKSHVKHIFTKLNVEKRVDAVARARSLGILVRQTIGATRPYNDHSFGWSTVRA